MHGPRGSQFGPGYAVAVGCVQTWPTPPVASTQIETGLREEGRGEMGGWLRPSKGRHHKKTLAAKERFLHFGTPIGLLLARGWRGLMFVNMPPLRYWYAALF